MNSPRLWILILALVSFLAGVAAGLVGGEYAHRDPVGERATGDFERRFSQEFDLDPEGRRLLGDLLASYHSEIGSIQLSHEVRQAAEAHAQMEPRLREAGVRFRDDVRDMLLLTEAQRLEFDRLLADHAENL